HPYEKWANYPTARKRLLRLIESSKIKNPILLSGDRHMAELAKTTLPQATGVVYELTSSGLTHSWSKGNQTEANQYRVGNLVPKRNFGLLKIDWDANPIQITAEIRGLKNNLFLQQVLKF
ncbi:MAG: alkaline phosphatase D family protein, partial [Saprospiraceae bacterium]